MAAFYSICVGISDYAGRIGWGDPEAESGATKIHRRLRARGFRSTLLTRNRATLGRFREEFARLKTARPGDLVVVHFSGSLEPSAGVEEAGGGQLSFFDVPLCVSDLAAEIRLLSAPDVFVWIDGRTPALPSSALSTTIAERICALAGSGDPSAARSVQVIALASECGPATPSSARLSGALVQTLDRHPAPSGSQAFFAAVRKEVGSTGTPLAHRSSRPAVAGDALVLGQEPPILDDSDVQAHVLVGFSQHARTALLFFEIADTYAFKNGVRAGALPLTSAAAYPGRVDGPVLAAAFTHAGLSTLGASALERLGQYSKSRMSADDPTDLSALLPSPVRDGVVYAPHPEEQNPAFQSGMAYRSRPILKDPWAGPGSLGQWKIASTRRKPLHGVVVIAAPSSETLQIELGKVKMIPGIHCVAVEEGYRLGPVDRPTEHFGFRDGVAKPGVAAKRVSLGPQDPKIVPEDATSVFPVDHLLVQGAESGHDAVAVAPANPAAPAWAHNGSFLVYRRLNQEVSRFRQMARELALQHESPVTEDEAAAILIGRAKDGTSLEDVAAPGSTNLGDPDAFDYSHDRCPAFAHARKVNPRRTDRESPPLFRRGVVFGSPAAHGSDAAEMDQAGGRDDERGLHFMCYQSSIERQFETISRWMNHPDFPVPHTGVDGLLGRSSSDPRPVSRAVGSFTLAEVVFVSGGEYFFAPSLSGLKTLCGD